MRARLALVLLAFATACSDPPHAATHEDEASTAPVHSRTRGTTLGAPSVDAGNSEPGLGTTEPTR